MATVQPGETVYTTWEMNGHLNNEAPTTIKILYYPDSSKEFKDVTERDASMVAGSMEFATNGNCYVPGNPNSVCFGSWKVPQDLVPGQTYHFVWFWYFNANPAGQWYSTCFDMKVESESHVVDSSKSMTELLKKGQPSLAYVYGFNDKVVAQVADVSSLSRYAHAANSSSSAAPMASATPMSSAAPMATPTITIDDGGRNPDPAAASTSTPVSSAPAPAMTATPVSSPAPVTSPAPVASPEVATMQDPKHPGKTLKCYRRRRAAN
ncbi:hypothetical protein FBU59_003090 [Linderina macrospora]|uniref:Uncharacterized protein n=1 Tax=Linderina macrospora TaxID=4868 RepID=A0ACC1J9I0_9FUNG|nr:hypothetical protein FBU59_003090 [Linderina macrospora]